MNSKKASTLFSLIAAGAFALACAAPTFAQNAPAAAPAPTAKPAQPADKHTDAKKDEKKDKKFGVGQRAPDFSLFDTEGKEHKLSSLAGKIVVLEWFNPECPYVVKHHEVNKTYNDLFKKYGDKVQFFAINSNAPGESGSGKERNAKAKKDWTIGYPILLDETGATGKSYNARNTPATYVIAADGTLAYMGAIDDDSSPTAAGKTNYAAKALDELLAGKPVSTKETKPYGCGVKYKN